jgi:hypothetical protein
MKHAIVAILLCAGLVGVVRADEMENYRQMIVQQKAQQQGYIKRLRQLPGKKKIEDILRVTSNQGKLELQSPLFAEAQGLKNQQVRAEVEGFEGDCTISVQQIGNTGNYFFAFSNSSYPLLQGVSNFAVRLQPGTLTISRSSNSRTKNGAISLVQSHGRAMYGPLDGVQLTIYGSDNTGRVTVSINLLEPDFSTLLRKHPREVDQYLRPLLRELKLDSLFAVDETPLRRRWKNSFRNWIATTMRRAKRRGRS